MPVFIDRHPGADKLNDMRADLERDIRDGTKDDHGVKTLAVLIDNQSDELTCVTDAPDANAVRQHHASIGIETGEIHEADVIL